jgi:hypothetical protein
MKILNVYGQEMPHEEVRIIGNLMGLLSLRGLIDKAVNEGKSISTDEEDGLFASDGEGYRVIVELHEDEWGLKAPKDSFWNKKESRPEYIDMKVYFKKVVGDE